MRTIDLTKEDGVHIIINTHYIVCMFTVNIPHGKNLFVQEPYNKIVNGDYDV